jgi:hypothetical protein
MLVELGDAAHEGLVVDDVITLEHLDILPADLCLLKTPRAAKSLEFWEGSP